ncbi:MAG: PIN domain-containing protein [Candidatus Woesearchaeota archaeon]
MVCLDTSFAIDLIRGEKKIISLEKRLDEGDEEITITTPSVMELSRGAKLSNKPQTEKEKVLQFLYSLIILDLNKESAILAGEIEADLRKRGEIIDTEDIMIAAIAIKNNETLLTRNVKHFERIKDLKIESY